jgi:hypothetical protein
LLRIKVACLSKAISLSVAAKSDRRCLCHVVWLQTCLVRMIKARLKMKGIHSLWKRTKPGRTSPKNLLHIETIDNCVVFSWVALLFLAATDENLPSALDRNILAQRTSGLCGVVPFTKSADLPIRNRSTLSLGSATLRNNTLCVIPVMLSKALQVNIREKR